MDDDIESILNKTIITGYHPFDMVDVPGRDYGHDRDGINANDQAHKGRQVSKVQMLKNTFRSRRHRLDDFVQRISYERSIGYIPKTITKMYLAASDFIAEHHLGGVQRPLDYTYAFFGVGLFMRKEQTAFSEILDVKPWVATFGNAVTGLPVGLSYYLGPNAVINAFGYPNGSTPEFNMINKPETWYDYATFGFAGINVAWDMFRMVTSPITKRAYPGFGLGVTAINLQSMYLNRKEFMPYMRQLGNQLKSTIKSIFTLGYSNPDT